MKNYNEIYALHKIIEGIYSLYGDTKPIYMKAILKTHSNLEELAYDIKATEDLGIIKMTIEFLDNANFLEHSLLNEIFKGAFNSFRDKLKDYTAKQYKLAIN